MNVRKTNSLRMTTLLNQHWKAFKVQRGRSGKAKPEGPNDRRCLSSKDGWQRQRKAYITGRNSKSILSWVMGKRLLG